MHIPANLTHALAHLVVFEPMKPLLTPDFTDRNCALPLESHRKFWPLHERRSINQPWQTARYGVSHDPDAGSALTLERACPMHGAYQ